MKEGEPGRLPPQEALHVIKGIRNAAISASDCYVDQFGSMWQAILKRGLLISLPNGKFVRNKRDVSIEIASTLSFTGLVITRERTIYKAGTGIFSGTEVLQISVAENVVGGYNQLYVRQADGSTLHLVTYDPAVLKQRGEILTERIHRETEAVRAGMLQSFPNKPLGF